MAIRTLHTALGVGSAMKEATRAGLDRAIPFGSKAPLRVRGVSRRWLAKAMGLPRGSITSVEVLDHHSGTAARARIAVESEAAEVPGHLFVKMVPSNYLQHVLMNLFRLGMKEIIAYRALGDTPPVRIPRCHVARYSSARRRSILVLEDLSQTAEFRTVVDSVTAEEAAAVVDALADLHAAFWNSPRFDADLRPLARRSATEVRLGEMIRRQFLAEIDGHAADLMPEQVKQQCRVFYQRGTDIDAFWASVPRTLTHGDTHLGNLFFEAGSPGFLDWQVAAAGPGIRDVAYFANASVEPGLLRGIETDLVRRYTDRLAAAGVDADFDRTWLHYRAAVTEFLLAAVCTAEAGERMQSAEVSRVGVERAVAGVLAHDSFDVLDALISGSRG
ncbi:MAG TPA: phosphotransferase [Nocardia sp.]|uniref:phosphotransferase n=1 Tax=Nocardia TaxID=1817 RepID=UPI002457F3A8|nr:MULTISPECIES: phosphotransferase [Nocardia]HLS75503.1 phosphotransferase [Nocardia sp.]